ncbi:hypothetical protein [Kaistella pullorum]|uniref:Uncharacterized protein n=1 Tax=Kaistella pullorum TaxID=2763074 RepID=A0ABR8WK48_9FLAO|nr:hypothetical protein [Kaistella pullorum]MBD8017263.1 hypothetical protein [Kaistella pullorum]
MKKIVLACAIMLGTATLMNAQQTNKVEKTDTKSVVRTPKTIAPPVKKVTTDIKTNEMETARRRDEKTEHATERSPAKVNEAVKPAENAKQAPIKLEAM